MFIRENWVLRCSLGCSIIINVATFVYLFLQIYQSPVGMVCVRDENQSTEKQDSNCKIEAAITDDDLQENENVIITNDTTIDDSPNGRENLETRLNSLIKCNTKGYESEKIRRGDFWVLKNYIRADHGEQRCFQTITYTTHGDYTFLDNLMPVLERWKAPISIALYAPGGDFIPTVNSIKYYRDCLPGGELVRQFATFHIYFQSEHIPKFIPNSDDVLHQPFNCSVPAPFANITSDQLYRLKKDILYPINVGRNIAREAAMTHFVLACDIELYPNHGLVHKFLEMIGRNDVPLQSSARKVFPLPPFEIKATAQVPHNKSELQEMLKIGTAIPFHMDLCSECHRIPDFENWTADNETENLSIFHTGKRSGPFYAWEPFYIGTNADPYFDERLSWEGGQDKMSQAYEMCALDYELQVLDNAFLIHKPGIKKATWTDRRNEPAIVNSSLMKDCIIPELNIMHGSEGKC